MKRMMRDEAFSEPKGVTKTKRIRRKSKEHNQQREKRERKEAGDEEEEGPRQ